MKEEKKKEAKKGRVPSIYVFPISVRISSEMNDHLNELIKSDKNDATNTAEALRIAIERSSRLDSANDKINFLSGVLEQETEFSGCLRKEIVENKTTQKDLMLKLKIMSSFVRHKFFSRKEVRSMMDDIDNNVNKIRRINSNIK